MAKGEEYKQYRVSTVCYFSNGRNNLVDSAESVSAQVWPCLEKELQSVHLEGVDPFPIAFFKFDGDPQFVIFLDELLQDHMFIVTDLDTGV